MAVFKNYFTALLIEIIQPYLPLIVAKTKSPPVRRAKEVRRFSAFL